MPKPSRSADLGGRSKEDLLAIVKGERDRSVGLDLDLELTRERMIALDYYKGHMPDLMTRPNRSVAVSTDVADTVETILPELMDIFVGGDDVVSFNPANSKDVESAQQETDYLHNVIFSQNQGFLTIHSFIKDALLSKTGIVKWYWSDAPEAENEVFEGKTAVEVHLSSQDGELINLTYDGEPVTDQTTFPPEAQTAPLFGYEMAREGPDGRVVIEPIAPEDFTVARDTIWIAEATYCASRSRPRAQDLKAKGHDSDTIDRLRAYGTDSDERVKRARDTAGENLLPVDGNGGPDFDLRTVEVIEHYIRLLSKAGALEVYRVFTDVDCTILIDSEKVDRIKLAVITPRIVTHRFYGLSIADVMAEIQRIKTSVLRMAMDHGYFAMNQRQEVNMEQANEYTLSDLLDHRPGRPVRSKGGALTPIESGGQPYDFFGALEYLSTMGEARSGVVRNAQGLNPDTLHDTASGAAQMLGESLKKIRFIARIIAETGLKDLYLGAHAEIREHATQPIEAKLRGNWVPLDPTQFAERTDMTVELGVGAGGRQQKVVALTQIIADQNEIAAQPGGDQYVTAANRYRARMDAARALGLKSPEDYYTDPSTVTPAAPAPNPEALKLQASQQDGQATRAQQMQIAQMTQQDEQRKLLAAHVQQMAEIASKERIEQQKLALQNADAERDHAFNLQKLATDTSTKLHDTGTRASTQIEVAEIGAWSDPLGVIHLK